MIKSFGKNYGRFIGNWLSTKPLYVKQSKLQTIYLTKVPYVGH